jgi:hypothetical protein
MQLNGNNTQDATKVSTRRNRTGRMSPQHCVTPGSSWRLFPALQVAPVNVKTDEGSLIGTALPISELPANDTELSMAEDYTATIQVGGPRALGAPAASKLACLARPAKALHAGRG